MDCPPPSPPPKSSRLSGTLVDLHVDTLAHCAGFLGVQDLSNLALTCKPLRGAAYSDSVWRRRFTERWPYVSSGASGVREEYLSRHFALQQMKFTDPLKFHLSTSRIPHSHILLNKNDVLLAQGSIVEILRLHSSDAIKSSDPLTFTSDTLSAHNARITCMRLFPLIDTSLFRNEMQNEDTVLITSSFDRTIRLWWKDRSQRCFKGHNGPVSILADKLLGDSGSKVLASGGEDCTVRLWSVRLNGMHHPLTMTYHGHERPVSLLSVASHKASLLVSISKDSRIRVWDTTASTSSSSCVGMACVSGPPVGMKCDGTLCYVAAGSSVTAIDLRTMQKVSTAAVHLPRIHSFEMLPSKGLICTGGEDRALLWDIRKNQGRMKPEAMAELNAYSGRVTLLHMDPYKVVTGGPFDYCVNVWETGTGFLASSLDCRPPGETEKLVGLSAMAVDGCRIATGGCGEEPGAIYYRDFSNCVNPAMPPDHSLCSKFWEPDPFSVPN